MSYGLRHSGCRALGGSTQGTQQLRLPQNPKILGQEGPQEGAQSFQAADLELTGNSQAEPSLGTPLTRGGPPAPKKGVRLPQLEAPLSQTQPLGSPRRRWGGRGMEGPTARAGKGPPCMSPNPRARVFGHVTPDSVAAGTLLCRCFCSPALPPTSSSGSIKIMSRAN